MIDANGVNGRKKSDITSQEIPTDHNERLHIHGFEKSLPRIVLTYIAYVLSIGWIRLLFHWYPRLHLYATHRKCALNCATKILVIDDYRGQHKSYFIRDVQRISTRDLSTRESSVTLGSVDQDLVEKIRNKRMWINLQNGTRREVYEYNAFWYKKRCYVWDITQNVFSKLMGLDNGTMCSDLHRGHDNGLSKEEQLLRRIVYGNNDIVVPLQSIGMLLLLEVLNPFYIFQVFTLAVWFAEGYIYYTIAIILMSLFGITSSIVQTRKNQRNLRGTVASSERVRVLRDTGVFEDVCSEELVPGDIIELPRHQSTLVCDAVLLTGQCILNESMLTGESVPVTKTSLPSRRVLYNAKECAFHTLYSGTTIIQTKFHRDRPVLARVIRTGFLTSKGALIAAILYPPPADFKFDKDSYKFIGILSFIAICGCVYTIVTKAWRGITPGDIAIKALDIITIVVPPALPAAMTVGKLYAQARLKRVQIYCINNRVINVSGSVNCVCFDKTGTLTEDGLDMWGVVPCTNGKFDESATTDVPTLRSHPLFEGMLVCHGLTLIDGELCGDPLDAKMFASTKWALQESDCSHVNKTDTIASTMVVRPPESTSLTAESTEVSEISIVQQYQFSSSLQRMSVIICASGSDGFRVYTKGSPEMITGLSKPETVPRDISLVLERYTRQGYRVIAMGRRATIPEVTSQEMSFGSLDVLKNHLDEFLPSLHELHYPSFVEVLRFFGKEIIQVVFENVQMSKLPREAIEQDLEFLGLIVLENRVKQPTTPVIMELREAKIRVLMITGDNIQTAISVARECGILSTDEQIVDIVIAPRKHKEERPEISFNVQSRLPRLSTQNQIFTTPTVEEVECGTVDRKYRFVLTGQTWQMLREHYPELVDRVCVRSAIFARMSSDQKQQLVMELMRLGYYVAMCGDGANDCGALRAAHVGISLSEAESSVASAFTSRIADITCVPKVIREGRAALVTSFGIFKFMVAYALTEFLSVIILYSMDSNLTDLQFLFIDIFLIINFAFFFGKTHAYKKKLSKRTPMTSLLSFTPLLSLTLLMLVLTVFQAIAYHGVRQFSWFRSFESTNTNVYLCYENYSVYCVSMFQYITTAVIFSRGKPYRRAIYTNCAFMFSIILLTVVCAYITIYPADWLLQILQMILPPYEWRFAILVLALINFLVCFFIESFVIERVIENVVKRKLYRPEKSKKGYLRIEHELKSCGDWPKFGKQMLPILSILRKGTKVQNVASATHNGSYLGSVPIEQQTRGDDLDILTKLPGRKSEKPDGFENHSFIKD